ncbi:MAG: hypothetical protein ABSF44_13820 [Candidatus Bathyarchaeia archaeon]
MKGDINQMPITQTLKSKAKAPTEACTIVRVDDAPVTAELRLRKFGDITAINETIFKTTVANIICA